MNRWPLVLRVIMVVLLTVLLSGCGILGLGSTGSAGGTSGGDTSPCQLPDPTDGWRIPPPVLTADEQSRQNEACQRVTQDYQAMGSKIVKTTQGGISGLIYDWLDTVAGAKAPPPPPPINLGEGAQPALTELDVDDAARGPDGTIPFVRDAYSAYVFGDTGAISLDDWIQSYQMVGVPGAQYRLYAGLVDFAPNQGANTLINSFGGDIELDTMSVLEMVVGCRGDPNNPMTGEMRQQIGISASRDNMNLKGRTTHAADSLLRIKVEFLTNGIKDLGPKHGGWDHISTDFMPPSWRHYPPGTIIAPSTTSTVGGTQYESSFNIQLIDGDWWVGWMGNWLGYYPAELFDKAIPPNQLATKACEVDWYGEVAARKTAPWTTTDMGSGQLASEGLGYAAYFRHPTYVSLDAIGTFYPPDTDPNLLKDAKPSVPACYGRTDLQWSGNPLSDWWFFVSGPGGDEPTCQYPSP